MVQKTCHFEYWSDYIAEYSDFRSQVKNFTMLFLINDE